jgi:3',5'-cyclic AMP phosphodiesterase CpdA
MNSRRRFLKTLAATSMLPLPVMGAEPGKPLRIGLITDVHKDIIHDADERLKTFIDAMTTERVDALMQMGDFCTPKPMNKGFLDIFNSFPGPKFHVLGNHDTDGGFTREQIMAFWGMKERYYSFDLGGFHFVMLDSNDQPADFNGGYPSHIADDQIEWLKEDLERTTLHTFVISHHSLEVPVCITSQEKVRAVLEAAKTSESKRKVAACFNGHWHIDHSPVINSIPYHHVDSAAYYWLGAKYKHESLSPELSKQFPTVALTAPYTKPLFTVLENDGDARKFSLRGAKSAWLGASPAELGFTSTPIAVASIRPEITAVWETFAEAS